MSITVQCPNGHVLKVKNLFAGKSGLCPECHARVSVPAPQKTMSEDDILGLMGPPRPMPPIAPDAFSHPVVDAADAESVYDEPQPANQSGINLLNSSILKRKKLCPHCGIFVSLGRSTPARLWLAAARSHGADGRKDAAQKDAQTLDKGVFDERLCSGHGLVA